MIITDNKSGCAIKWIVNKFGQIDLIGSGCEFSDWFSFFSHERQGGLGVRIRRVGISESEKKVSSKWEIKTKKGSFSVEVIFQEETATLLSQRVLIVAQPTMPVSN